MYLRNTAISLSLLTFASITQADFYVGAMGGSTDYTAEIENVTSLELIAGYRLNENFGVEASWLELGEAEYQITNTATTDYGIDGTHLALLTYIPLTPDLEVYGKFGVYYWDQESTSTTTQTLIRSNGDEEDRDLTFGAGLSWNVADNITMRLQHQQIDVQGENIKNTSAGLTFSF